MKDQRKAAARLHARLDALDRVAEQLRKSWLALDQHRGLASLAPVVEEAVDAVEEALRAVEDELEGSGEGRLADRDRDAVWTPP